MATLAEVERVVERLEGQPALSFLVYDENFKLLAERDAEDGPAASGLIVVLGASATG